MGYGNTIRKRKSFVDRLTSTEVGLFVGLDARTVKSRFPDIGTVNAAGWHIYTVQDACRIFVLTNNRKPRGSEIGMLLEDMGCDLQTMELLVLRLAAIKLSEYCDLSDTKRLH